MSAGLRRAARAGFSLVELSLALGLAAALGVLAGVATAPGNPALGALQGELKASLEQALLLARARGCPVRVALGGPAPGARGRRGGQGEVAPLTLPRGVRWGLPHPAIPLPEGMEDTRRAHLTGQAHACITVSPARTAEASAWFLTDGRDAVCLRLSPFGRITLLRWRHRQRRWSRE